MLSPWVTSVFAPAAAFCTSPIFAALVALVPPLATLLMALPPALMPPLVTLGPPAMVKPSLFTTVLPVVRLPEAPKLIASASLTVRVSVPATTPMLPSVRVPVLPPTTLTVSPSLRSNALPLSPTKVSGVLAWSFAALMASLMLFAPVPPMLLMVVVPSAFTALLPPKIAWLASAIALIWPPFTASVLPEAMLPAAKPLILLLAPSIFTPPTFTVSKVTSLAVATV